MRLVYKGHEVSEVLGIYFYRDKGECSRVKREDCEEVVITLGWRLRDMLRKAVHYCPQSWSKCNWFGKIVWAPWVLLLYWLIAVPLALPIVLVKGLADHYPFLSTPITIYKEES